MKAEQNLPQTDAVTEEIVRIGDSMTRMRVMMGRRVIGKMAIARAAPGLDLSQLDILHVVRRIETEGGEATVGAIAEAMRLDPSRGSRIVADLVSLNLVRRQACQSDGRRSILRLTNKGEELLEEIRTVKHSIVEQATSDWSEHDKLSFAQSFSRFMDGIERLYLSAEKAEG
jgi:DNA-binding MarR family transcriptional regulator